MKSFLPATLSALLLFLTAIVLPLNQGAQPKTKAPQGAVQMPGDNGKLGTPYQLGKKGDELVFTLEKAEFASRALMKDAARFPAEGQRLVVLTYAVQNPGKADRLFFEQSFQFTVVSPDDQNYVCEGISANGFAAFHPDRKDIMNVQLKPAQKVRALAVISIHPKGPINKLIVQRGKGTPVLRYDLKEKVGPMKGAFAADGGLDILDVGRANLTVPFDLANWDLTIEKVEDVPIAIGDYVPNDGQKWVVLTMTATNAGFGAAPLNSSIITGKMFGADGDEFPESLIMVKNSSTDNFNANVEQGATVRFRMLYKAPLLAKADHVIFKEVYSERRVNVKLEKPKEKGLMGSSSARE